MKKGIILVLLVGIALVSCSSEPETVATITTTPEIIEVTRIIENTVEIEVTRLVEITENIEVTREVEVTRLVEVIVDPTLTPTALPTITPEFGGKDNPYPLGVPGTVETEDGLSFQVTFLEVIRGDEAYRIALNANSANDPPPEGSEFIFARIEAEYTGDDRGLLEIKDIYFQSLTNNRVIDRRDFDDPCCYNPEFHNIALFQGGIAEGWNYFLTSIDDPKPLAVLDFDNRLITQPAYFSLATEEIQEKSETELVGENDAELLELTLSYIEKLDSFQTASLNIIENIDDNLSPDSIDDTKYNDLEELLNELVDIGSTMKELPQDFSELGSQFYDLQMATKEACNQWAANTYIAIGSVKEDLGGSVIGPAFNIAGELFPSCTAAIQKSKPELENLENLVSQ